MTEAEVYTEIVKPLTAITDWADLRLGIGDPNKLFKSSVKVFHAPYREEGTTLYLPKNQTYTYRLLSGDHEFTNEYYGYFYYQKQEFDIYLTQDHLINATTYHVVVSKWDTDWMGSFITVLIWTFAILLIFGIPALVYAKTGDPSLLGKAIVASIIALPTLALFMSWIVNWAL
jgi:hypothetical protein